MSLFIGLKLTDVSFIKFMCENKHRFNSETYRGEISFDETAIEDTEQVYEHLRLKNKNYNETNKDDTQVSLILIFEELELDFDLFFELQCTITQLKLKSSNKNGLQFYKLPDGNEEVIVGRKVLLDDDNSINSSELIEIENNVKNTILDIFLSEVIDNCRVYQITN